MTQNVSRGSEARKDSHGHLPRAGVREVWSYSAAHGLAIEVLGRRTSPAPRPAPSSPNCRSVSFQTSCARAWNGARTPCSTPSSSACAVDRLPPAARRWLPPRHRLHQLQHARLRRRAPDGLTPPHQPALAKVRPGRHRRSRSWLAVQTAALLRHLRVRLRDGRRHLRWADRRPVRGEPVSRREGCRGPPRSAQPTTPEVGVIAAAVAHRHRGVSSHGLLIRDRLAQPTTTGASIEDLRLIVDETAGLLIWLAQPIPPPPKTLTAERPRGSTIRGRA